MKGQRVEGKPKEVQLVSSHSESNSPNKPAIQEEANRPQELEMAELTNGPHPLMDGSSQPLLDASSQPLLDGTNSLLGGSSQPLLDGSSQPVLTNSSHKLVEPPSNQLLSQSKPFESTSSHHPLNSVQLLPVQGPEKVPSNCLPEMLQGPSNNISSYLESSKQSKEEQKSSERQSRKMTSPESFYSDYTAPIVFRDCNITIDAIYNDRGGFDPSYYPIIRNISPIQHQGENEFKYIMDELDQIMDLMEKSKRLRSLNVKQNTVSV